MNDVELSELKDSVQRLEAKVHKLLAQPKKRTGFLWKEFFVGFLVVYIIMTALTYGVAFLNARFGFFQ